MDSIDKKILECLTKNARANASEIAETAGLSVSATIERIKKMEGGKVILGYSAIIDPKAVGKDVTAIMSVVMDHPKYNEEFERKISNSPNIVSCMYLAGDYDYILKVVVENTDKLVDVLNSIKGISGVSKTKTNVVLSTPKAEIGISF